MVRAMVLWKWLPSKWWCAAAAALSAAVGFWLLFEREPKRALEVENANQQPHEIVAQKDHAIVFRFHNASRQALRVLGAINH
jgi:hypothetical protein